MTSKFIKWMLGTKEAGPRGAARSTGFDLAAFKARLGGMAADDPLWGQLMALLDANVWTETQPLAAPGIGDEEAHRLRGRVGMLLDLKSELERLWGETHPKASEDGR